MSDKVFFLRFKDHCATLNMFVTLAVTGAIRSFTRTLSARHEDGEGGGFGGKAAGAHLSRLASLQSQQINYSVHLIQIDFLTQITMLSSRSGHVSLIRESE